MAKEKKKSPKATQGMVRGQITLVEGNPFIKAMHGNLKRGGGRPKVFETPKMMLDAMETYATWAKDNPIMVEQPVQGVMMDVKYRRPLTLEGFCLFCGVSHSYFRLFRATTVKDHAGFQAVMRQIEDFISDQLFEGAAVGQFNANLISKKLGLAENLNLNHGIQKDQVSQLFPFAKPKELEE